MMPGSIKVTRAYVYAQFMFHNLVSENSSQSFTFVGANNVLGTEIARRFDD